MKRILVYLIVFSFCQRAFSQPSLANLQKKHAAYLVELDQLRQMHQNHRQLPAIDFFLFGMGDRKKMVYKNGTLLDAVSGKELYNWKVKEQDIFPSEYTVHIKTSEGKDIFVFENEKGVFLKDATHTTLLSGSNIHLPEFTGNALGPVLKVLHQEILINIINGKPVPNFLVYQKPWNRDATLMAMVLKETGNLPLIKD